jgi:LuxR family maltose regulon positive regulatory protein
MENRTTAAPSSKHRIPRPRREVVPRPDLLARLRERAADARLVLVQAPAGFGKTTLLVQLAAALAAAPGGAVCWVSLDAEDNDANRLFAALFGALAALDLPWSVPPATVLAQLQDASPAARTALGPLIDALGARPEARIALVLDDLHHISDAAALQLLDTLIARAPPELCVFIGSRVTPPLSLARWRAGGELVALGLEDLQFDLDAAQALCQLRGLARPSDAALQAALARTHGWVAGLQLVLGSARGGGTGLPALIGPAAHRHLFDYFAQEVLAELPAPLQQFVLHSSVLPELSPVLCQAVTGRTDARAVLDALFGRQLFLSALDERVPLLRFHDVFRDFLQGELERREPGRAAQLHARAAAAEAQAGRLERAVPHWLAGGCWADALAALRRMADGLLAVGGTHRLERWLEQLPPDWREPQADAALLRGLCAWSRWDWLEAREHFQRATTPMHTRASRASACMRWPCWAPATTHWASCRAPRKCWPPRPMHRCHRPCRWPTTHCRPGTAWRVATAPPCWRGWPRWPRTLRARPRRATPTSSTWATATSSVCPAHGQRWSGCASCAAANAQPRCRCRRWTPGWPSGTASPRRPAKPCRRCCSCSAICPAT